MRRNLAKYATLLVIVIAAMHFLTDLTGIFSSAFGQALVGMLLSGGLAWLAWRRYRLLTRYEQQNYDWYVAQHPPRQASRPECSKCGSTSLRTSRLMRYTYSVEHACGTCGTPLYYSEER
ncbi:CopD family protein [Paraburkholderia sp. Ac-20340]|uniref:hypothetical protein n=1 Tax=Paraburkholderia sp. Ac-20340 TaxID=2703888 RepID=UPI00197D33A9|nr:hypothetical protein [Paraburkholderia sp. Ac-20340]MBN3852973.1 CopD family protein [Paraburkholderia sp. Ac-20340]